ADPEGVDRERGRIWRVVYTGKTHGAKVPSRPEVNMDLGKLSAEQLVQLLAHPNIWQRRMAERLLAERRDPKAVEPLKNLLRHGETLEARLFALWTLHSSGQLDDAILDDFYADKEPAIRAWVARLAGERRIASENILRDLQTLAADPDPSVRLAVATAARQFASGSLTVDTPAHTPLDKNQIGRILAPLVQASSDGKDPLIPFMVWEAAEPGIAEDSAPALRWLSANGPEEMPLSGQLARKTIRRICDTQDPKRLDDVVEFIGSITDKDAGLTAAALDGLLEGQQGKALPPAVNTETLFAKLFASGKRELVDRAQNLGALWGNPVAIKASLASVNDSSATADERAKAIHAVRKIKSDDARAAMLKLLSNENPESLVLEAIRALGEIGGDSVPDELVKHWQAFTPESRRATAEVLASRHDWSLALLAAIEAKTISPNEISATVVRSLNQSGDPAVRQRAVNAIGRVRPADADKLKIIAQKKKMILSGPADLPAGREIAKKTCFICHKLYGEGADVGPDLTGVGRSTLDALLANVIDPNQVIGKGYENVEVQTKDGRSLSGRMVEDTATRVKLLSAGPKEDVIARSDIASLRVSELSVMPEGLEQMPEADFRNLILFILHPPQDKK
ncbi:MAG TPA: HEAT repeat domain-containing protein, partial [Verrucomicrobiae bacterium]|nr:HEAT repeat domain-containing protein [Verrucomicrobiae bacterium]